MTTRERVRAFDAAHPRTWDVGLTLLVILACTSASAGLDPVGAPFLFVACGAVACRRRAPLTALGVAVTAVGAGTIVSMLLHQTPPWCHLAIWILLFQVGLRRRRALPLAAALAAVVALAAFAGAAPLGALALDERLAVLGPVLALSVASLLGGSQLRISRAAQRRERDDAARAAAAAERVRISREVHDLVGHDLSVIASLSAGGENVVRSSPEDAARAFAAIGEVSRASVGQLRQVLRLLRADDDSSHLSLAPPSDLSQLGVMIDAVRAAGLRVDDERQGDLEALLPSHRLAVFRIVQEALTNTMRHAGGGTAVAVRIVADDQRVVVSVADRGAVTGAEPAQTATDGHGILGMRERAAALGGSLEAGPTAAGWLVRAEIPREGGGSDESPSGR